jgi:hypothetical protein
VVLDKKLTIINCKKIIKQNGLCSHAICNHCPGGMWYNNGIPCLMNGWVDKGTGIDADQCNDNALKSCKKWLAENLTNIYEEEE